MTERGYSVAVVGATTIVGTETIAAIERHHFPVRELRPVDQRELAGTSVPFAGHACECVEASARNLEGIDLALFCAGSDVSRDLAPAAVALGAVVIDSSPEWRLDLRCPLVVAEANFRDLFRHRGIIATPQPVTVAIVLTLKPLYDLVGIKRVVVSTYQAVSDLGKAGLDALYQQTREIVDATGSPARGGDFLAFNVTPQTDSFGEGDYTNEELLLAHETAKVIGNPSIRLTATCVRVPVPVGHSLSVNVETMYSLSADDARELLREAPGVRVVDDPSLLSYPMPLAASGEDFVTVGRIRQDPTITNGLNMWVVVSSIRKGIAINAVQIAQQLAVAELVSVPYPAEFL